MKKKIIFCLLSLSLMIAGCQSNEIEDITPPSKEVQLSPEELLSIRYKSSPELSQTEVFNLVLRNKLTPLQIVITNGYTCSIFQVAKIAKKGVWLCSLFFKTIFRLIIDEVCIISTRYSASFS